MEYPDERIVTWFDDETGKNVGSHKYLLATDERETAPELLEALEDLWMWVKNWDAEFMDDPEFDRSIYEAAIAKARGGIMTNCVKNSTAAYNLIHKSLYEWISSALEEYGFDDEPSFYVDQLMQYAGIMREIEKDTDITWPDEDDKS